VTALKDVLEPTELDIAWAAGLWEGEGWVQLWRHKPRHDRPKTYVYLQACASQKDPEVLHRLKDLFGGHVARSSRIQDITRWTLNGGSAERFFDAIYPYLSQRRRAQIDAKRTAARAETGPTRDYIRRAAPSLH
jgi:hypothetical protein